MTSLAPTIELPPSAPPDGGRATADGPRPPDEAPGPAAHAPHDDREAMVAEQMAACHRVVLDCLARAGDAEAARHGELRLAARFMTLFLRQNGALDRHRDHVRRARAADEKAGRDRLNRQVTLAAAQGRGLAQGFEASLRRFEQAARERRAGAEGGETPFDEDFAAPLPEDPVWPPTEAAGAQTEADPADPAAAPAADDLEGWTKVFAAPQRRAEAPAAAAPPSRLTRQQRRAAKRAQEKAARAAKAG
jgi:hypothetical protein